MGPHRNGPNGLLSDSISQWGGCPALACLKGFMESHLKDVQKMAHHTSQKKVKGHLMWVQCIYGPPYQKVKEYLMWVQCEAHFAGPESEEICNVGAMCGPLVRPNLSLYWQERSVTRKVGPTCWVQSSFNYCTTKSLGNSSRPSIFHWGFHVIIDGFVVWPDRGWGNPTC